MVIVTASGEEVENSQYWKMVNISSCVTRVDTGGLCDLATFPSPPSDIKDLNFCCNSPLSFQEFGFCPDGNQYNVPVCHTHTSVIKGGLKTKDKVDIRQSVSQTVWELRLIRNGKVSNGR